MLSAPNDILRHIAQFINNRTLMSFRQVNKWTFANISADDFISDHMLTEAGEGLHDCLVRLRRVRIREYGYGNMDTAYNVISHLYLPIKFTIIPCSYGNLGELSINIGRDAIFFQFEIFKHDDGTGKYSIEFTRNEENGYPCEWILQFIEKYFKELYDFITLAEEFY